MAPGALILVGAPGTGSPGLEGTHCADGKIEARGIQPLGTELGPDPGPPDPAASLLRRWPRGGVQTQAQVSKTHLQRGPGSRGPAREGGTVGMGWDVPVTLTRGYTSQFRGHIVTSPAQTPQLRHLSRTLPSPATCMQPHTASWADGETEDWTPLGPLSQHMGGRGQTAGLPGSWNSLWGQPGHSPSPSWWHGSEQVTAL